MQQKRSQNNRRWWQGLFRVKAAQPTEAKGHPLFGEQVTYESYIHQPGKPVWMPRDYAPFAEEAYRRNVIAHRSIRMIATAAASVPWVVHGEVAEADHPLLRLMKHPSPGMGGARFMEMLVSHWLISGNAYVLAVGPQIRGQAHRNPTELHLLRPDRVQVLAGAKGMPSGYRYTVDQRAVDYHVNSLTGRSAIFHCKAFHPLNDWYGLSGIEAAAYSIDQHNAAGEWNQSLLQNGARPSGAVIVKRMEDGSGGYLSEDQYQRIRGQIDEHFAGARNAGRPILLEGGLDWREMSISPKEMDFIEMKHSAARDIALALGVPPQLLGIPGDNTYSNLAEARLALWEQTVIPMLDILRDEFNAWLPPMYAKGDTPPRIALAYDLDEIPALAPRREAHWKRINEASFLSGEEKREALRYPYPSAGEVSCHG